MINNEFKRIAILLKSIPAYVTVIFVLSIITMNLLAQITVVSLPWLALNAGVFVSWLCFLCMDVVTKRYGARAANILSIMAITINLIFCGILFIVSKIGTIPSLDMFMGGAWSITLASTIAFILSAITNNYSNVLVGKMFKNNYDSKVAYVTRTYVSTMIGQFVDNFSFVFLAFVVLPLIPGAAQIHWTIAQCLGCSIICAIIELLFEVVFSPFGYKVNQKWKEKNVGVDYLNIYYPEGLIHG